MSYKIILPLVLLLSVALVAGCVDQLSSIAGFGSDVIKPSRTTTAGPANDIIAIDGMTSSPESVVQPDQNVRIFMTASSRETDARKTTPVKIQLYDAFAFKSTGSGNALCNSLPNGCTSVGELCTVDNPCTFSADETKQIQWSLKAPSTAEIANIATSGTLAYRLFYDYTSSTNFDVLVVTENEILRLQQQGQTLSVPLQESRSSGPVVIEFNQPTQFTISGNQMFVTVKLVNAGSGSLIDSTIGVGKLSVEIPTALTENYNIKPPTEYFPSTCDLRSDKTVCINNKPIQFIKKESIPLLFTLESVSPGLVVPHRTFTLSATVLYSYEIRRSLTLTVQPLTV